MGDLICTRCGLSLGTDAGHPHHYVVDDCIDELKRELAESRSSRTALLAALEPAGGNTMVQTLRYSAQDCKAAAARVDPRHRDAWISRASELDAMATALEAALRGVSRG